MEIKPPIRFLEHQAGCRDICRSLPVAAVRRARRSLYCVPDRPSRLYAELWAPEKFSGNDPSGVMKSFRRCRQTPKVTGGKTAR